MYRKESDQTMAIGPEQLDLKKLAKFFILDGELESKITKEMIKAILETFEPDDWMYIKPNFEEVSTAKAKLRELIKQCEIFLGAMSYSVTRGRGQFLTQSYVKLKEAVKIAKNVYQSEDDEMAIITTDSLKQIFLSIAFECIEDDDIQDNTNEKWFSGKDYYGNFDWIPYKKFIFDSNTDSCLFVYPRELLAQDVQLPWEKEALITPYTIDGIYVEYMEGNEPRNAIITRTNAITLNNGAVKALDQLGGELEGVTIIDGSLSLALGLVFMDMGHVHNSDVDFGTILSSHLKQPINVVPVRFGCENSEVVVEEYLIELLEEAGLFTYNKVSELYEVTDLGVDILHLQKDEVVTTVISTIPDKDIVHLTGYTVNSKERLYIDNKNRLISGIANINASHVKLFLSSKFRFLTDNDKIVLTPSGNSVIAQVKYVSTGKVCKEFAVVSESLLVDQNAIFTSDKYISKYRHFYVPSEGSVERSWIPAAIVGNYYISPEPIDSDLRLYKENSEIIQIIGILDEKENILYTRMNEFLKVVPFKRALQQAEVALAEANEEFAIAKRNNKVTQALLEKVNTCEAECAARLSEYRKVAQDHPLLSLEGQYQIRPEELGYYNGHLFCESAIFEKEIGERHYSSLVEYIKYMDAFKDVTGKFIDLSKKNLIVESEFNPILINNLTTGSYYWSGNAKDIIHLPDSKDDCLTYLNISGFKSKPASENE